MTPTAHASARPGSARSASNRPIGPAMPPKLVNRPTRADSVSRARGGSTCTTVVALREGSLCTTRTSARGACVRLGVNSVM